MMYLQLFPTTLSPAAVHYITTSPLTLRRSKFAVQEYKWALDADHTLIAPYDLSRL